MIERIEVVNGAIPLTETEPRQQWVEEWSFQLFVKVTAGGRAGWGETLASGGSFREPYSALVNRLAPVLRGMDESETDELWTAMRRLTFSGGYGVTTGAISGIDIALWDLKGKKAGKPLAELLGGRPRAVPRYASLSRYRRTEDAVAAVGWALEQGYTSVKLHQSGSDSLEAIALARAKYGHGFDLEADLNCAFTYPRAMEFMRKSRRHELKWAEEPLWPPDDFDGLRRLNKVGPVAAGENFFSYFEFKRLMEMDALSYYQPDIAKIGGVTPALAVVKLAKKHGAALAFHDRPDNGWVSTIGSAHIASALSPQALVETPPNELPREYFEFAGSMDKTTITPAGPGLGIAPLGSIPTSTESKMLVFHER
jgi:L-alanine-DL-glutamate epimerase-like enolase superfamily enzyme